MTGNILLQARDLSMYFGGVKALDKVDFSLDCGELRCLIGPNGAGKSTFFKCLTGQYNPTMGEVLLNDEQIGGIETASIAKKGVGIKTQIPNVFDGLTVRENVWVAVRTIKDRHKRNEVVETTLDKMGIAHIANEIVGQLAHGQRQFVELSMVIAENPELILLDEPAAGLSSDETVRLAEIIQELNQDHALIVVEHDMQFIRMIGKQVTVFHQGKILVEDSTDAILSNERVRDVYLGKTAA